MKAIACTAPQPGAQPYAMDLHEGRLAATAMRSVAPTIHDRRRDFAATRGAVVGTDSRRGGLRGGPGRAGEVLDRPDALVREGHA